MLQHGSVQARVVSLRRYSTIRGTRIYALFQTVDGCELGLWAPADEGVFRRLNEGDQVVLLRNRQGHLSLPRGPVPNLQRSPQRLLQSIQNLFSSSPKPLP